MRVMSANGRPTVDERGGGGGDGEWGMQNEADE